MKFNVKEKYEGFSLVEMLISILIIGMVMLIASTTLTTLIKVSSVSSNKTRVRTETEFVLELIRRTVRNSDPSEVYIYNSEGARKYDPDTNLIVENDDSTLVDAAYSSSLGENVTGNEIHFRPYGYENWMCLGFFKSTKDDNVGYILKTSAQNLLTDGQSTCFADNDSNLSKYIIVLNSSSVSIKSFDIEYTVLEDNNYLIRFDIDAEPTQWYLGENKLVSRDVHRQTVVSTEGIVW